MRVSSYNSELEKKKTLNDFSCRDFDHILICVGGGACSRVGCLLGRVSGIEGAADRLHHGQAAARVAALGLLSQSRHTRHLKQTEKTSHLHTLELPLSFFSPHSNEPLMERAGVFCCCSALDYFAQQQRQLLVRRSRGPPPPQR